ncbi:LysR family transcriptional regulator [Primorskyibacter sp. S87]|uniref:LysR family transcriptional regulator n=1 Tax=Primorskyibacter sp. S87 TaxID=3415126 RepID=UPI003C7C170E
MSRLIEMEAFATVVEQGGFTDAARKMGISKSAVSKHIAALEQRLGARLLSRTTRSVNPTEIGMVYYDRTSQILNDAGDADALVAELHARPSGALRVASATDFGIHVVTPLLPKFLQSFPDISLNLELSDTRVDLISNGFDLALRSGDLSDSTLMARKLASYRTYLVASPAYLLRNGRPEAIEDLQRHQLLQRYNRPGRNQWRFAQPDGQVRAVQTTAGFSVNDGTSLLNAAIAGLGIARLPGYLVRDALDAGLVENAMPDLPEQQQCVHAVYPTKQFIAPKLRAFIDYLVVEISMG